MPFADTDFLVALIKNDDWLKESASSIYQIYKGQIWTSPSVIIELLFICNRWDLKPEKVVSDIYALIDVRDLELATALLAAHYISEKKATILDSLHAAYAQHDIIISSDSIYDKLGLERLKLRKE